MSIQAYAHAYRRNDTQCRLDGMSGASEPQRLIYSGNPDKRAQEGVQTFYICLNPVEILNELNTGIRHLKQAQLRRLQKSDADANIPPEA